MNTPTLYFDSFCGLIPLRRARTSVSANGSITSVVARTHGAYRAGDVIEFLWTSLVFKARRRNGKQLVIPACAHLSGTSEYRIMKQKWADTLSAHVHESSAAQQIEESAS